MANPVKNVSEWVCFNCPWNCEATGSRPFPKHGCLNGKEPHFIPNRKKRRKE